MAVMRSGSSPMHARSAALPNGRDPTVIQIEGREIRVPRDVCQTIEAHGGDVANVIGRAVIRLAKGTGIRNLWRYAVLIAMNDATHAGSLNLNVERAIAPAVERAHVHIPAVPQVLGSNVKPPEPFNASRTGPPKIPPALEAALRKAEILRGLQKRGAA